MTEINKVGQRVSHSRQFDKSRYNAPRGGRQGQKHFFDRRRFTPPRKRETSKPTPSRQYLSNLSLTSLPNLPNICSTKIAGRLKHFTAGWEKLTSDKAILDSAAHYHIEFIDNAHPTYPTSDSSSDNIF